MRKVSEKKRKHKANKQALTKPTTSRRLRLQQKRKTQKRWRLIIIITTKRRTFCRRPPSICLSSLLSSSSSLLFSIKVFREPSLYRVNVFVNVVLMKTISLSLLNTQKHTKRANRRTTTNAFSSVFFAENRRRSSRREEEACETFEGIFGGLDSLFPIENLHFWTRE